MLTDLVQVGNGSYILRIVAVTLFEFHAP